MTKHKRTRPKETRKASSKQKSNFPGFPTAAPTRRTNCSNIEWVQAWIKGSCAIAKLLSSVPKWVLFKTTGTEVVVQWLDVSLERIDNQVGEVLAVFPGRRVKGTTLFLKKKKQKCSWSDNSGILDNESQQNWPIPCQRFVIRRSVWLGSLNFVYRCENSFRPFGYRHMTAVRTQKHKRERMSWVSTHWSCHFENKRRDHQISRAAIFLNTARKFGMARKIFASCRGKRSLGGKVLPLTKCYLTRSL